MSDLTITLKCNNNCIFCVRNILKDILIERSSLDELIMKSPDKGHITLTGGEVTILKDILKIVELCKRTGFKKIAIVTNGRRLSDLDFLKSLIKSGVSEIAISVYSNVHKVHDYLTGIPGSCNETFAGLKNISSLKKEASNGYLSVRVNLLINSKNLSTLYSTLKSLYSLGIRDFLLLNMMGDENKEFFVSYENILKLYLSLSRNAEFAGSCFIFRGYPLCVFAGFLREIDREKKCASLVSDNLSDFKCENQDFDSHKVCAEYKFKNYIEKCEGIFTFLAECKKCSLYKICSGIQAGYIEKFPDTKLKIKNSLIDNIQYKS